MVVCTFATVLVGWWALCNGVLWGGGGGGGVRVMGVEKRFGAYVGCRSSGLVVMFISKLTDKWWICGLANA